MGENDVKINAAKSGGKRALYPHDPKSPMIDIPVEYLPDRYHQKTELVLDVKERTVKKDFDLKK
jgi:hypothetical protein